MNPVSSWAVASKIITGHLLDPVPCSRIDRAIVDLQRAARRQRRQQLGAVKGILLSGFGFACADPIGEAERKAIRSLSLSAMDKVPTEYQHVVAPFVELLLEAMVLLDNDTFDTPREELRLAIEYLKQGYLPLGIDVTKGVTIVSVY